MEEVFEEVYMSETMGTVSLKITRLKQRLTVLEQQQRLSGSYPDHRNKLLQEIVQVQFQLCQLSQYREELAQQVNYYITERLFDGDCAREKSLYPSA
jgi:hypothetical protein